MLINAKQVRCLDQGWTIARILGTVNRPIPAASCSTQYLMQVSSKRPCVLPPVPISCLVTMPLKIFVGNACCLAMPQIKVRALYWCFRPLPPSCLLAQCDSPHLQAAAFQVAVRSHCQVIIFFLICSVSVGFLYSFSIVICHLFSLMSKSVIICEC